MEVILHAIHDQRRAFLVLQRPDHVGVELLADVVRLQEGLTMFRAEDDVQQDVGE
jgi:hypothetical protein